ncbi:MAG: hypothetical protein IJO28_03135 [Oscillospiraceae bacterium]|nr:hypothetical protein [Oscillospiraceae bacterium]
MIGSGLKKFAIANGMGVQNGVAYGNLRGYAVTLQEGSGYKQMVIATRIIDQANRASFEAQIGTMNLASAFKVQNFQITVDAIYVTFKDSVGTMQKLQEFTDWFFPALDAFGATKADICSECGTPIMGNGIWMLRDGAAAFHVHGACGQHCQERVAADNAQQLENAQGSYVSGAVGAALGAIIGALVWGLVLMAGYVASIVGLLIGFLSKKGYDLLKGKQGKAKIVILIAAVILGVILGTYAGTALQVISAINEGGMDMSEFGLLFAYVLEEPAVQEEIVSNILMGLVFAALGVFGMLRTESKAISGEKIQFLQER